MNNDKIDIEVEKHNAKVAENNDKSQFIVAIVIGIVTALASCAQGYGIIPSLFLGFVLFCISMIGYGEQK